MSPDAGSWRSRKRSTRSIPSNELLAGVDVPEGVGLVVERHLDHFQRRVPLVDLALPAAEKRAQRLVHLAPHQAEHGMRLVAGLRHREIGACALERGGEARHEVGGKERRIARHRDDQIPRSVGKAALESRERAGKPLDLVGDHAVAERGIRLGIAVGVDEELVDLRREALDRVRHHGLAAKRLQPLVHAAHSAPLAAREHDARDPSHRRAPSSSPCVALR